ncbi:hypothetical protein ACFLXE_05405 [Chloroflexota bacterium]
MHDALLKLRHGGSSPRVTGTEAGVTSLTRDAGTGQAVVQVDKLPVHGLPIHVYHDADTGSSTDKTLTVTIEASDALGSGWAEVVKFPEVVHGAAKNEMVRTIASQKKYLRSVITAAGSDGTISVDFVILVGSKAVEED